ncbi:MAG: N-acetylglucosamine-6-phosphate deacetylase [Verrucomicrobiota bacterium]
MNYFDIQVNGYGGIDFNKEGLTADELHRSCERLQKDGVAGIFATICTAEIPVMCRLAAQIVKLRDQDTLGRQVIAGIHFEGPFMNETAGYRGAHPEAALHPANLDEMKQLLAAAGGLTKLVTLAPERDPGMATTRYLAGQGIVVSAGHTNASLDDLKAGIDAGLKMFTHLGNGCPMQMHRHDNIIQRALSLAGQLWLCFIADGVHVPFFALKNYLKVAGIERSIITTDAVAPAGLGPGTYTFGKWKVVAGEDMALWAPDRSHLVGSGIFMPKVEDNLRRHLGLGDTEIRKLICDNPRRAFGL